MSDSYKVYASEEYVNKKIPSPDGAHKMLVTNADGTQVWEDRTHWAESSSKIAYDGTVNPAGASYGSVYLQVPNGMDIISLEAQSYTLQFCGHRWDNLVPFMYDEHVAIGSKIADETIPFVFVNDNGGDGTTTALMLISQSWVFENLSESDLENPRLIIIEHSNEIKKLDPKYLPEDHINGLIDTKLEAAHSTELITIPASAWTGTEAPYFAMNQACSIATMTNTLSVSLSPTLTNPDDGMAEILSTSTYNAIAEARIMAVVQADGAISFAAYGKKPEIDIPVIVTEVG